MRRSHRSRGRRHHGRARGFNIVPPFLPQGFEDFARLVIPELQRRGIFHREYEHDTFRANLGLHRPANQHVAGQRAAAGVA